MESTKKSSEKVLQNSTKKKPSLSNKRKSKTSPKIPEPPQPSPSSSVGRIPKINLSPPATAFSEKKAAWPGDLVFPLHFELGDCEKVVGRDGKCTTVFPSAQKSDLWLTSGKDERVIDHLGDRLYLYKGDKKRYLYTKWGFVAPEVKRKDFTIYLRDTGILQVVAKFLLALESMSFRPPPEEAITLMIKSISAQFFVRTSIDEMMDYRDKLKVKYQVQIQENENLLNRLEKYGPVFSAYEALNPDDFNDLTFPKQPVMYDEPETVPSPVLVGSSASLPHMNFNYYHDEEEDYEENKDEEDLETGKKSSEEVKISIEQRKASLEERRRKYAELMLIDRDDLDVASLAQHFKNEKIGPVDSFEKFLTTQRSGHNNSKSNTRCVGQLPPLQIAEDALVWDGTEALKLPPRILNDHLKLLGRMLVTISPPSSSSLKFGTEEEDEEEEEEEDEDEAL